MICAIFTALLFPSVTGACLAAVIVLARPLTRKVFGYSWHYYIWLTVLFTMLLPVQFRLPGENSVPPITPAVQMEQTEQTEQVQHTDTGTPAPQVKPKMNLLQMGTSLMKNVAYNRRNLIAYIWLAGAVILFLIHLIGYIRLIRTMRKYSVLVSCPRLADFTKRTVAVRVWENTASPFMVGIVRPTLVLPARALSNEQQTNILRHEMTHFRRHDILYKWFTVFVTCVHWFNPMIWVAAKQIHAECEISCDMAITQNMSLDEKKCYVDTLLSLLPRKKTNQISLTTQMASSKTILKRRFTMMKLNRATSKFVSVLSAMLALAMLTTTVFASGIMSGLTEENYTVKITNNGGVIELVNKPFIENGEVYVPLRETFEQVGVMDHPQSAIEWQEGNIALKIALYDNAYTTQENEEPIRGEEPDTVTFIFNYAIEIGVPSITLNAAPTLAGQDVSSIKVMSNAPVIRGGNTYIPFSYVDYLLDSSNWMIEYEVYDKDGNEIGTSNPAAEQMSSAFEQTTELITYKPEPDFFADPYSEFLTDAISQSLDSIGFAGTYSYEYILHRYNFNNDGVTFQYQIKPHGEDKTYILSMFFENRSGNWIRYDFYMVDPVDAVLIR